MRTASVADVGRLAMLRHRWRHDELGETGLSLEAFTEAFGIWMRSHANSHLAVVAERGELPIGMGFLAIVDRVPGIEMVPRTCGYLQSVYVTSAERNAGVGTTLVAALIAEARRLGLDYLAVHPSEPSVSLYRRLGFAATNGVLELALSSTPRR